MRPIIISSLILFALLWFSLIAAYPGKTSAAGPSKATLYDLDTSHLWNRLHQALHFRQDQALFPGDGSGYAYGLDACLWPDGSSYLRSGEPHKTALALLDEFLATGGEQLVREPTKRAFLQRDLWAVFDWTRSSHDDVPGRNLRVRLARAIQRLALSPEEIGKLPDNLAAVTADNIGPQELRPMSSRRLE